MIRYTINPTIEKLVNDWLYHIIIKDYKHKTTNSAYPFFISPHAIPKCIRCSQLLLKPHDLLLKGTTFILVAAGLLVGHAGTIQLSLQ